VDKPFSCDNVILVTEGVSQEKNILIYFRLNKTIPKILINIGDKSMTLRAKYLRNCKKILIISEQNHNIII